MFGKYVTYASHKIWVWCVPSTTDFELQELAEAKYDYARSLGLKDFWFREYLKGEKGEEYLLADQAKYSAWHLNT